MGTIPLDLVFHHLSWRDRVSAMLVCKEWRRQMGTPSLWRKLDLSNVRNALDLLVLAPRIPQFPPHLQSVNLQFVPGVEDGHLAFLEHCHLVDLNLNGCQKLTDAGVARLIASQPGLQQLSLYWILSVGLETLTAIGETCTHLRVLNLSGCKKVSDEGLQLALPACSGLIDLDLTRCVNVTDDGYVAIAASCPQLQVLRMYACMRMTGMALQAFAQLKELRIVDLCGAHLITDDGLCALAACPNLRSLNLTWCIQLTDRGVCALAERHLPLEELSLHGIRGVTDACVAALSSRCGATLHTLDVRGCAGIVGRDKASLLAQLPHLTCFQVHS